MKEYTFHYDIEYTVTIPWSKTFQIEAESLADAKRQAEQECHAAEVGEFFHGDIGHRMPPGTTVESAEVEMDSLVDEQTGDTYESLAIEPGDEAGEDEEEDE
jgi:hypothetical protein